MYIDLPHYNTLNKSQGQRQETPRYDKLYVLIPTYEGVSKSLCTNIISFNGIRYHTKHLSCVNVKPICV